MSVKVNVLGIDRDREGGHSVAYSLDYADATGRPKISVCYEGRTAEEFEAAADAIALGRSYYARGEATFEIFNDGTIELSLVASGDGNGGSLNVELPAAPWEAAFREIARVLRTGEL